MHALREDLSPRIAVSSSSWERQDRGQAAVKLSDSYPLPAAFQASTTSQTLPGAPIGATCDVQGVHFGGRRE
jgi:hypothetical protein